LAGLLIIGFATALIWARKKKKKIPLTELEGERRVKPSEMEPKELDVERVVPPMYEMPSEQEHRKNF